MCEIWNQGTLNGSTHPGALRTKVHVHKNEQEHPWEATLCRTVPSMIQSKPCLGLASQILLWPIGAQDSPRFVREQNLYLTSPAQRGRLYYEYENYVSLRRLRKYRHKYWAPIGRKPNQRQGIDWVVDWNCLVKRLSFVFEKISFARLLPSVLISSLTRLSALWFLRMFTTSTSVLNTLIFLILLL